jgi:hypothetical protein
MATSLACSRIAAECFGVIAVVYGGERIILATTQAATASSYEQMDAHYR